MWKVHQKSSKLVVFPCHTRSSPVVDTHRHGKGFRHVGRMVPKLDYHWKFRSFYLLRNDMEWLSSDNETWLAEKSPSFGLGIPQSCWLTPEGTPYPNIPLSILISHWDPLSTVSHYPLSIVMNQQFKLITNNSQAIISSLNPDWILFVDGEIPIRCNPDVALRLTSGGHEDKDYVITPINSS